jgi:hypothetical protein
MDRIEKVSDIIGKIQYGRLILLIDGGKCTATVEKWKRNPSRSEISDAVDNTVLYEFGGVEVHQGNCTLLKQIKKIRI